MNHRLALDIEEGDINAIVDRTALVLPSFAYLIMTLSYVDLLEKTRRYALIIPEIFNLIVLY